MVQKLMALVVLSSLVVLSGCSSERAENADERQVERFAYRVDGDATVVFYLGRDGILDKQAEIDSGMTVGEKWTRVEVPADVDLTTGVRLDGSIPVLISHEFNAIPPESVDDAPARAWYRIDMNSAADNTTGMFVHDQATGAVRLSVHFEDWSNMWNVGREIWVVFDISTGFPLAES